MYYSRRTADPAYGVREVISNSGTEATRHHLRSPSRLSTDRDHVRSPAYKCLVRHEGHKSLTSSRLQRRDHIPRSRSGDRFLSLEQYERGNESFPEKQKMFSSVCRTGRRIHDLSPRKDFHQQLPSDLNVACWHFPYTSDRKMKSQPSRQKHSMTPTKSASIVSLSANKSQSEVNTRLLFLAGQSKQDDYVYGKSREKSIEDMEHSDGQTCIKANNRKLFTNTDIQPSRPSSRKKEICVSNVRTKPIYGLNKLGDALHSSFPSNLVDTRQSSLTEESNNKLQTFSSCIQCCGVEWKSPPQRQSAVDSNKMQSHSCVSSLVKAPHMSSSVETMVRQTAGGNKLQPFSVGRWSESTGGNKLQHDNVGSKAQTADSNKVNKLQSSNIEIKVHSSVGSKSQKADGKKKQPGNIGSGLQTIENTSGNKLQPCNQTALEQDNMNSRSLEDDLSSRRVQRGNFYPQHTSSTSLHCSPAVAPSTSDFGDSLSSSDISSFREIDSCSDNVSDVESELNESLATKMSQTLGLSGSVDCGVMNTKNTPGYVTNFDNELSRKRRASVSPSSDIRLHKVARKQDTDRRSLGTMNCKVIPVVVASNKMSAAQCSMAQNLTVGTTFDLLSHLSDARSRSQCEFDPDKVVLVRGSKEGSISFHSRPEFLGEDQVLSTASLPAEATTNVTGILLAGQRESDPCVRLGQYIASHIDQHIIVPQPETNLVVLSSSIAMKSREIVVRKSFEAVSTAAGREQQLVGCTVADNQSQVVSRHIVRLTSRNKPSLPERVIFVGSDSSHKAAVTAPGNTFDLRAKLLSKRNRLKRFGVDESQSSEATSSTSELIRRPVNYVEDVMHHQKFLHCD